MDALTNYLQQLAIAVLVGKVTLLSFVVAPVLAKTLDRESFAAVVRALFPAYYLLGMGAAVLGLLSLAGIGLLHGINWPLVLTGLLWLLIFAAESYCRSPLTPLSNEMRDRLKEQERQGTVDPELRRTWDRLHRWSVWLNSTVLLAGLLLLGLVGRSFS
ncbi:MAG: DUF4149 domain-containing protein [Nitrospiraceae bacterium]|nr:DUF4149 domain-containing protein [Nitrospiraceae bacterium]